jgi:hypothetical protein
MNDDLTATARYRIHVIMLDGHGCTINRRFTGGEVQLELDAAAGGGGITIHRDPGSRSFTWIPSHQVQQIDVVEITPESEDPETFDDDR